MKKNISINLFGTLYNIDEDAYNLLDNYLNSMHRYFSRQEGGEEIADDIEHRVAELLWKDREAGMTAIDIHAVKEIIDTIGNAEDIAGESGNKSESAFANYNKSEGGHRAESGFKEDFKRFSDEAGRYADDIYTRRKHHVRTHRFYRCADDKVLGGVYIVIWLVTPAAITPEDRLRQKGMDVNPDSLAQQVKYDSEPIVVKNENKGCLKAILIAIAVCCILPLIFFFSIWGKIIWELFSDL